MTDKEIVEWLRGLASGKGFASYLIGEPEKAKSAADAIERLAAEVERLSLIKEERDTLMKRYKEQIEVIRARIDKGGLCDIEKRLLNDLKLPSGYDRRQ